MNSGGDISALRRLNLQAVLRVLHSGGRFTISELAHAAQLSRPTTTQAVEDLVAVGWVEASQGGSSVPGRMGRPAQVFGFRPEAGYVLGADVGAHKVAVLIGDLNGTVLARARRDVDPKWSPELRLGALGDVVDEALTRFAPGAAAISDAAIATVGRLGADGGVIFCSAIPGWQGQNPARWLSERYGFFARGANDMNMSALAEHWRGAAQDAHEVVYLHAGRRLGTGLLIGGRPHLGHHAVAAEIGFWRGLQWKSDYDTLMQPFASAAEVFAAAALGDAAAQARVEALAQDMCQGLAPIVITVDPELVVIGGGISAAGEAIAGPLRRRLELETGFPPRVVCSTLGDESAALGALRLALDSAEERMFAELTPQRNAAE